MKLLEDTNYFQNENQSYKGYQIFADGTAHGDGSYTDNYNRVYHVDAGIIGIMPVEAIESDGKGGNIIEFKEDFRVTTIKRGVFKFGNIVIDTTEWDDEDDEDDDYEENILYDDQYENNQEGYFNYLDDLRESGVTNMYGAVPYLISEFPSLSQEEAKKVLINWMESFSERHKKGV
jgi:hypothetical protein